MLARFEPHSTQIASLEARFIDLTAVAKHVAVYRQMVERLQTASTAMHAREAVPAYILCDNTSLGLKLADQTSSYRLWGDACVQLLPQVSEQSCRSSDGPNEIHWVNAAPNDSVVSDMAGRLTGIEASVQQDLGYQTCLTGAAAPAMMKVTFAGASSNVESALLSSRNSKVHETFHHMFEQLV